MKQTTTKPPIERPSHDVVIQRRLNKKLAQNKKASDRPPPLDARCALRVKIKTLAHEAKIIRNEENRTRSLAQYNFLHDHRTGLVRRAAREALLALSYIRGREYEKVETKGKDPKKFHYIDSQGLKNIWKLVRKYGPQNSKDPRYTHVGSLVGWFLDCGDLQEKEEIDSVELSLPVES